VTPPPGPTVEANGPAGSRVDYAPASAIDPPTNGPVPTSCAPVSGSLFPLGATTVTCRASDSAGNVGTASFTVTVRDTTAPVLTAPKSVTVAAATAEGTPAAAGAVAEFLRQATARDLVDTAPVVTHDAPAWFAVGATPVTFRATDRAGNTAAAVGQVEVLPSGAPAPPSAPPPSGSPPTTAPAAAPAAADVVPPSDVTNLVAAPGDRRVTLRWRAPGDADFDHVVVSRSSAAGADTSEIYRGASTSLVDRGVRNGTSYRYMLVAYDRAGNRSLGVPAIATPRAAVLRLPAFGARVASPPRLAWVPIARASYYNVQLFRGTKKILSVWPRRPQFQLVARWKYLGRKYRLTAGEYRWYVWPGFGPLSKARYGQLVGESRFAFQPRR
jgi:HYR domain